MTLRILRYRPLAYAVARTAILLAGTLMTACVEEYWPPLGEKYDRVLVVDGCITDQPGPHMVRLSLSTNIKKPVFDPQTGYEVTIADDQGNEEVLADMQDGSYRTHPGGMQGIPGRSYRLRIVAPDGKKYESDFEMMHDPVGIDSVWAEFETREDIAYDHLLEGYRFRVTTEPATRDTVYFLWKLEGTYQYHANHYIKYIFDGEMRPFPMYDSLYMCWKTYTVHEIFTFHTLDLSQPLLRAFPLNYVSTEDKKLSIRYSLNTRQYVISKEAYGYWDNLRKQNTDQGSLYAAMPFQVRGNVRNVDDPEELVLGYFMASPVSVNRMFVSSPWWAEFHYAAECNMIIGDISHQLWLLRDHWPVYLAATYTEYGQSPALPVNQECVDCTKSGGTINKPEFWIGY